METNTKKRIAEIWMVLIIIGMIVMNHLLYGAKKGLLISGLCASIGVTVWAFMTLLD